MTTEEYAQKIVELVKDAVAAEREACAKIAGNPETLTEKREGLIDTDLLPVAKEDWRPVALGIAKAIRARS